MKIKEPDGSFLFKKRKDIFKDYAFCSCLNLSLKRDSINFRDNSLETLYDLSNDDLTIGNKGKIIDSLVLLYINSRNSPKHTKIVKFLF